MTKHHKQKDEGESHKTHHHREQEGHPPTHVPTKQEINEGLETIYAEKDGEMPDLTKLDVKKGSRFRRALVSIILLLLVISGLAWGGFLLYSRGIFTGTNEILVTEIEGPTDIEAGEEVMYQFRYENTSNTPIASLSMKLNLPIGFEVTGANPEATDGDTWTLGNLTPGSDGSVAITGIYRAEVPSTQTVQAFFTYRPGNFSSDFEEIETLALEVENSVLDTAVTGPEKALAGDEVSYVINVQNTGLRTVKDILVSAAVPEDFTFTSSDPTPVKEDQAEWMIESLDPGALAAITITGSYTSSATGEQLFTAETALVDETTELTQGSAETLTDVLGGTIAFSLIVDGTTENLTANLDENLIVSIDYANSGNEAIENLRFTLDLESDRELPIDWESANIEEGVRDGNTLTWDSTILPEFLSFQPSSEGVIDIVLPLLEVIDLGDISDRFSMKLTADLDKVGSVESPRSIENTPIEVAINSDLTSTIDARYFNDDGVPLGSGALPPKVGETTTYHIAWRINNSLHTLENILMSTNLPPDVSWTGATNTDIGTITFDTTTRLVQWKIDKLPTEIPHAGANFEVAITPDENDVGAFFKLTNATSINADDTITDATLTRAIDILTSEIPNDAEAAGKGVVLE